MLVAGLDGVEGGLELVDGRVDLAEHIAGDVLRKQQSGVVVAELFSF